MSLAFFISLFNAQHVLDVNTSILRSLRLICWVISWVVLLCKDRDFALVYLFSDECLVVTCVVVLESLFLQILAAAVSYGYWIFFVCSMFFDVVSWIYSDVMYVNLHIPGMTHVSVTLWFDSQLPNRQNHAWIQELQKVTTQNHSKHMVQWNMQRKTANTQILHNQNQWQQQAKHQRTESHNPPQN